MFGFLSFAVFLLAVVFAGSQQIFGQATTGTLRGVVNDQNRQVVSGATVVAKNEATGV